MEIAHEPIYAVTGDPFLTHGAPPSRLAGCYAQSFARSGPEPRNGGRRTPLGEPRVESPLSLYAACLDHSGRGGHIDVENAWLTSALCLRSALLLAPLVSITVAVSVALIEVLVGLLAGNLTGLALTPWINYLAVAGAILLTFLARGEIDRAVVRKHFRPGISIGIVGFFAPFSGVLLCMHYNGPSPGCALRESQPLDWDLRPRHGAGPLAAAEVRGLVLPPGREVSKRSRRPCRR